jgi:TonB family protein
MGKKILIVDFDIHSLDSLSRFLRSERFKVVTATDGQMGLEKFKSENPDLVIMEAMLPKLHGFELCKKINHDFPRKVPIIILSGIYRESFYKTEAARFSGASEFLEKPWKKEALRQTIQKLLEKQRKAKEEDTHVDATPVLEVLAQEMGEEAPLEESQKGEKMKKGTILEKELQEAFSDLKIHSAKKEKKPEISPEIEDMLKTTLADLALDKERKKKTAAHEEKKLEPREEPPVIIAPKREEEVKKPQEEKPPFEEYMLHKKAPTAPRLVGLALILIIVGGGAFYLFKPKKSIPLRQESNFSMVEPSQNITPKENIQQTPVETKPEATPKKEEPAQPRTANNTTPLEGNPEPILSAPAAPAPVATAREQQKAPTEPAKKATKEEPSAKEQTSPPQELKPTDEQPKVEPTTPPAQEQKPTEEPPKVEPTPQVEQPAAPIIKTGDLVALNLVDIPPVPIKTVEPVYPELAIKAGVEGVVIVNALISEKGDVINTKVVKGIKGLGGLLDKASDTAVKRWKFQPAVKGGVNVKVWKPINITFKKK